MKKELNCCNRMIYISPCSPDNFIERYTGCDIAGRSEHVGQILVRRWVALTHFTAFHCRIPRKVIFVCRL